MKKESIERISSEDIINLFEEAFEEQVASLNNITSFSVESSGREIGKPVRVTVDIVGSAGAPTIEQFRNGEVENCKHIKLFREDIGEIQFKLLNNMTVFISGNDYQIVYEIC